MLIRIVLLVLGCYMGSTTSKVRRRLASRFECLSVEAPPKRFKRPNALKTMMGALAMALGIKEKMS
jgi:hypothetical protein